MTELLDRIRTSLVGLRMPRALEALDHTLRRLERGELSAIEAIDGLLAEEHHPVDYLRNGRETNTIVAYGARARPGAPVSMPLAWDELVPEIGPAQFTVANAPARVANTSDPWADFRHAERPLPTG